MSFETPNDLPVPQEKIEENLIHQQIAVIESIPTGVARRAEVVLVYLGKKPACEMYIPKKEDAPESMKKLESIGLHTAITKEDEKGVSVTVGVAQSEEILEELKHTKANSEHRRYGELMGFPATAIDAFLEEKGAEKLPFEDEQKMRENLPQVLDGFRFSKDHKDEELVVLKDWMKTITQHAPELIDDLYKPEDAKKFKENLAQ